MILLLLIASVILTVLVYFLFKPREKNPVVPEVKPDYRKQIDEEIARRRPISSAVPIRRNTPPRPSSNKASETSSYEPYYIPPVDDTPINWGNSSYRDDSPSHTSYDSHHSHSFGGGDFGGSGAGGDWGGSSSSSYDSGSSYDSSSSSDSSYSSND